jgi:NAD(P)-dependent dehydrogenase (short-subunit alcohol dehydrogenase family)
MDVCDPDSVEEACQRVSRKAQSLDILISNAGINLAPGFDLSASRGPLAALDPNALGELFKTNALGNLNVLKAFRPLLAASSESVIVCISSDRASIASAGRESIGYSISKAALNMLVRKLAPELGDAGIKIVAVHPGWLRTDMGGPAAPVDPDVAANRIVNLAEKADYPTGSFLSSDGTELPW